MPIHSLHEELSNFQPWHAARASMLARLGRAEDAGIEYHMAIQLAPNTASRTF